MPETGRFCPRCKAKEMIEFPAEGGLVVDYCPSCQGLWCDRGELETLVAEPLDVSVLPLPFSIGEAEGPACPGCRQGRLTARHTVGEKRIELLDCLQCGGTWLDGGVLQPLRKLLRDKRRERQALQPRPRISQPRSSPPALELHSLHRNLAVQATALPVAFLIGLLLSRPLFHFIAFWPKLFFHELGHAIGAWLGGIMAIPMFIVAQTWIGSERLAIVVLAVATGLGFLAWLGVKKNTPSLVVIAAGFFVLQLLLTFAVTTDEAHMWLTFAGSGSELILSTLAIVAFYYRAPPGWRWDFWRFVVLVPAATVFCRSLTIWLRAKDDTAYLPMGSAVGSAKDGDLNRMIDVWGWNPDQIAPTYLGLAFFCGLIIVGHYVLFTARAYGSRAEHRSSERG